MYLWLDSKEEFTAWEADLRCLALHPHFPGHHDHRILSSELEMEKERGKFDVCCLNNCAAAQFGNDGQIKK